MNMSKITILPSLFVLVLFLSACGSITNSNQPANKTWWLEPYTDAMKEPSTEPVRLVSVFVSVVPGLDTNRVLTLSSSAELNRYSAARWADNLPELLASLVGRTLESSGRFEVVADRVRTGSENCSLQLEVHEFFARLDGSGKTSDVQVSVKGRYQCGSATPVPVQLSASVPVYNDRMAVIVTAFQQAVDGVMKGLLEQLG